MLERFVGFSRHAAAHVVTQLGKAEHPVLKEIVVLDVRVVQRHDPVQVAMFPAQVVAHDRSGRGLGLFWAVVVDMHKGLCAKAPSLPNFIQTINQ
jgi:hypothetical protein